MSSSYPKYYLSGEQCHWRLIIAPHQSLLVTLLDLQLRGVVTGQCRDGLTLDNKITQLLSLKMLAFLGLYQ